MVKKVDRKQQNNFQTSDASDFNSLKKHVHCAVRKSNYDKKTTKINTTLNRYITYKTLNYLGERHKTAKKFLQHQNLSCLTFQKHAKKNTTKKLCRKKFHFFISISKFATVATSSKSQFYDIRNFAH